MQQSSTALFELVEGSYREEIAGQESLTIDPI